MAIARITAVGESDWTIGLGSIEAIEGVACWVAVSC
jgi:hypothetical protein